MIVLNSVVLGTFFVGGAIAGAAGTVALVLTAWCYRWPRGAWK